MIITNSRQKPTQSAEFEEKQFSIRLNPKLFEALGSLYTDPILALCREYMTNADEAHQLAGHNRPIEVTLPTKLAPEFIIRDQGPGLPKEKLFELFTTYGASGDEKETSNDYEGGFGLGGKCWRAYADSIIVESCHNGTKTTYSFFLDETNMGKAAILATEPSRSSGITIKVPVKKEDIDTFTNRAANIAWMFPVRPRFTNLTDAQLEEHVDEDLKFGERKPIYRETRYVFFGDSKKSFVRMGRLLYPIGTSHLPSNFNVLLKNLIESGIVLELNVGEVDLAPSRETLKYTTRTVSALFGELKKIADSLSTNLIKTVDQMPNEYEAILKVNELSARGYTTHYHYRRDSSNFNKELAKKLDGKWTWQGKPLATKEYSIKKVFKNIYNDSDGDFKDWIKTKGVNMRILWKHPHRDKLQTDFEYEIIPHGKAAFFLTERSGFPVKRIKKYLDANKETIDHVYAIGVHPKSRDLFTKVYPNFWTLPFLKADDLPELSPSEMKDGDSNGIKSRKHCDGHFFQYTPKDNPDKLSDNWEIVNVDADGSPEVWVLIDKFEPKSHFTHHGIKVLRWLGVREYNRVIGVKIGDKDNVPNHWVSLDDAIQEALSNWMQNPVFKDKLLRFLNHKVFEHRSPSDVDKVDGKLKGWTYKKTEYYHKRILKILNFLQIGNPKVSQILPEPVSKLAHLYKEASQTVKELELLLSKGFDFDGALMTKLGLSSWASIRDYRFEYIDATREFIKNYPVARFFEYDDEWWNSSGKQKEIKKNIFIQYVNEKTQLNQQPKEVQ